MAAEQQPEVVRSSSSQAARERAQRFPPVLVMAHPSMEHVAAHLVFKVKDSERKGDVDRYRSVEMWEKISWKTFRDKWPNIFIDDVEEIAGRDVIFVASFHNPEVIFEQLSLIYSLPRYLVRSFRLILPFFPTGTMERVDKEGQVVTAKTLATMLSQIPLASRGPAQIIIFDIHSLQERFYFSDQVIPRLLTAMPLLCQQLQEMEKEGKKVVVVFPDEGASKRFRSDLHEWGAKAITCMKVRNGDGRVVKVKDGDPGGCDVVIVDDLIQTGGTIIECAKVLKKRGAATISVFVTHAVFPVDSWVKFINEESWKKLKSEELWKITEDSWKKSISEEESWEKFKSKVSEVEFAKFWVTDSLPLSRKLEGVSPFHVLSLCDVITESLLSYDLLFKNA